MDPVLDTDTDSRPKRPHLITRPQVVDRAVELLDREGTSGLSMRKLAGALGVSLPTVYAAVVSRNHLVRDVLRRTVVEEVATVGAAVDGRPLDPVDVLGRFVDATARRPWIPELARELSSPSLGQVLEEAAREGAPSVVDRLAEEMGPDASGGALAPGRLLFLVMLLLDDVGRLVEAGHCPPEQKGSLGYRLLRTVVACDRPAAIAIG